MADTERILWAAVENAAGFLQAAWPFVALRSEPGDAPAVRAVAGANFAARRACLLARTRAFKRQQPDMPLSAEMLLAALELAGAGAVIEAALAMQEVDLRTLGRLRVVRAKLGQAQRTLEYAVQVADAYAVMLDRAAA